MRAILQTRAPENFRSSQWGAERRVSRAQTRERGPHRRERNIMSLLTPQIHDNLKEIENLKLQVALLVHSKSLKTVPKKSKETQTSEQEIIILKC